MSTPIEDEFTELVDADIPRVDLVDKAANGTTFLIAKQAGGSRGLLAPEFVRGLIGDPEPEPVQKTTEEMVTMSGSPGAIARLIHEASLRRDADAVAKAEKSTKAINDLPDSDFAYIEPGGKKDDEGKTVPRDLRHFPIMDEAHVRNALSRAPQSPFGDKAMPKIRAAAKKFGIDEAKKMVGGEPDEGVDGMDPTVVLAAPEDEAPGDPAEPGSPAWESIDAATARKWTSILARARSALEVMADREMLEAATADPDDAQSAYELQDAACAIDYAISIIAPFAVDEQAEADCGTAEMEAVGKALAGFDAAQLDTIEAGAAVRKAGRVLSSANEAAIRGAVESLQKVLASLPSAPVEKTANEEPNMPQPETAEDVTEAHGQEAAMGSREPEPKPVAGMPVTEVGKADGEKPEMVAVFNAKGKLVGIVDPAKITPVAGADADDDAADDDSAPDDASDDAPETPDLEPQPAAEAGTPADQPADSGGQDGDVTKSAHDTDLSEMLKSSLIPALEEIVKAHSATQAERVTTIGDAVLEMADMVETLKGRIGALEEQPAEPRVFTNGAVPPAPVLRGQDRGAPQIDQAQVGALRKQLYRGATSSDQDKAAIDLQALAIAKLQEIHQRRP